MSENSAHFDPLNPKRSWTVCFYSFRGGVGRTTLAVSAAASLDEKTCLLDFDLEAPGVDEFECLRPRDENQPGLVEYVSDYVQSGAVPNLTDYVYRPNEREPNTRQLEVHEEGMPDHADSEDRVTGFVMRAGRRDRAYRKFLAEFNWAEFYRSKEGYLFFENLRAGIKQELGCNYLIVDSRTGLTHIGGVCIGHLADTVVLVFQPNASHGSGLAQITRAIIEREAKEHRPIPRLYVASKVPQLHHQTLDPDAVSMAKKIVQGCEEGARVIATDPLTSVSDWEDADSSGISPRKGCAFLLLSPLAERVKSPHVPDSYVALYDGISAENEQQFVSGVLKGWVKDAEEYACEHSAFESLKSDAIQLVRSLAAKEYWQLRGLLDAERTQLLLNLPKEVLDELPKSHLDELADAAARFKIERP